MATKRTVGIGAVIAMFLALGGPGSVTGASAAPPTTLDAPACTLTITKPTMTNGTFTLFVGAECPQTASSINMVAGVEFFHDALSQWRHFEPSKDLTGYNTTKIGNRPLSNNLAVPCTVTGQDRVTIRGYGQLNVDYQGDWYYSGWQSGRAKNFPCH